MCSIGGSCDGAVGQLQATNTHANGARHGSHVDAAMTYHHVEVAVTHMAHHGRKYASFLNLSLGCQDALWEPATSHATRATLAMHFNRDTLKTQQR